MRKKLLVVLICIAAVSGIAGIVGCQKQPKTTGQAVNPEIISAPTAGNIAVGESTDASVLSGEFSVEGELKFSDEAVYPDSAGTVEREWTFTPFNTERYNSISGKVTVNVYHYKLTFEENGGFDIADEYFNESFTLKNKPLTAKNDYRFDGWLVDGEFITYPKTFTQSANLYAAYRYHTADKLFYMVSEGECIAEASWKTYWENEGDYEAAEGNHWPIGERNPYVNGEVIIADMHDDYFVTTTMGLCNTDITSIVFNNYTNIIQFMGDTKLKSLVIPNTVSLIPKGTFSDNPELESIIYEDGESAFEIVDGEIQFGYKKRTVPALTIANCPKLKTVECRNVKEIGVFINCGIEKITIPAEVETVGTDAFYGCTQLKEVKFEEGSNLKEVKSRAFGACTALEKICIPEGAQIYASAFDGCSALAEIDISDYQITQIARHLHAAYIDGEVIGQEVGEAYKFVENNDFKVNVIRGEQFGGDRAEGECVAGKEEINLYIDKFSIYSLTVLCHEFFHHYQQVLCYGIGDETWESVPLFNDEYFYETYLTFTAPTVFIEKDNWEQITHNYNYGGNYTGTFLYVERPMVLIDEDTLNDWRQPYIELEEDKSNFDEYWNQLLEVDARGFASWFTGVVYEESFG